jgi:hypothetical protein
MFFVKKLSDVHNSDAITVKNIDAWKRVSVESLIVVFSFRGDDIAADNEKAGCGSKQPRSRLEGVKKSASFLHGDAAPPLSLLRHLTTRKKEGRTKIQRTNTGLIPVALSWLYDHCDFGVFRSHLVRIP